MPRPALEIADIFRDPGAAWRRANRGHVSHAQLKVMNAIEGCRTAALGGYVAHCTNPACSHTTIAYCSCRNRHCPRCQGSQASEWLEARKAELLEVPYFHVVFTLPPRIGAIAFQNKAVIYDLLFKASAETLLTIHVYAKRPFAGPEQVLAYLARYTHRVAISSSRLVSTDENGVTFKYKDYRIEGPGRYKTMTVAPAEFIRRFMLHVLPKGFHRIRHYGLLARSKAKADTLARARELIAAAAAPHSLRTTIQDQAPSGTEATDKPVHPCPCCGGRMVIIELFEAGTTPRNKPTVPAYVIRIDTS